MHSPIKLPDKKLRTMKRTYKPTAIDLFSGCGGTTCGLVDAGFQVLSAVEIDPKAQETYRLNHPHVLLIEQDIRTVSPVALLAKLGIETGDLDLLAGCPPCQGFSRLRTKNQTTSIDDERNDLVTNFLDFVDVMKPRTVMLENVPALAKDVRFEKLSSQLKALGYLTVVHVLDAADYGVPQRRKRLILLASNVHAPSIAPKSKNRMTVREAIKGIGAPSKTNDKLHALGENRTDEIRDLIARIPKNGGSRIDLGHERQLDCHKRMDGFHDVYGRMSWDDVSPTITSGCHNPSKGRFLHPSFNRTITLREASILQGFPKDYKFNVAHGKSSIALMIGNALPPPFISAHARNLKEGILKSKLAL
jgi:DNA (cytosine-5)-methyltransferase 1